MWKDPTTGIIYVIIFGGKRPQLPSSNNGSFSRSFERASKEQREEVQKSYSNNVYMLNTSKITIQVFC